MAQPPYCPPSLTLSVHGAREGPAPRAQVSSLLALPCPLPGVSHPLRGANALPCPSSRGDITVAALVKPRAKRPRAAAGVLGLAPCSPRWPPPPRDPAWACWGWRALATQLAPVACLRLWNGGLPRAGWGTPAPPPPLLRGCRLAAPLCRPPPPPGVGVPLLVLNLVPAVTPSWAFCPLPVPRQRGGGGWGGCCRALLELGEKSGRGGRCAAHRQPLRERRVWPGGGGACGPPSASLAALWRFSKTCENNTHCCSDKGVALARDSGGMIQ